MRIIISIAGSLIAVSCSRDVRPGTVPTEPTALTDSENPVVSALPDRSHAHEGNAFVDPGADAPARVDEVIAVLQPASGSSVSGVVRFRAVEGDVDVTASVEGLAQGVHAYHVHVFGDCSTPDAKSAGPHFHFHGSSFDQGVKMITGNLGELAATGTSTTTHRARIPNASLHGPFSIIGRSIIVHEQGNNPAVTPDGGAGKRIACGVIGVASPQPQTTTRR